MVKCEVVKKSVLANTLFYYTSIMADLSKSSWKKNLPYQGDRIHWVWAVRRRRETVP